MAAIPMIQEEPCCAPIGAQTLDADEASRAAGVFKALADPARVRIVSLLATSEGSVCVCDLTPHMDLSQPTVSFHLKKLLDAGLIEREQRGKWAYYSIRPTALSDLANALDPKGR